MSALLDTCVVSETYKQHPEPAVLAEIEALDRAYVSVITIGEILKGAHQLAAGEKQREILARLDEMQRDLGVRILPVDVAIARLWGQLTAVAQRQGRQIAAPDGLIAATARCHELPVMTRNVDDFIPAGVEVVNPWPS